ncbi:MAG: HAMP domain-containing protein [Acidobacteria bacterium]|nr:HAMP domain-containing protein [Acidobacteriota bacterium]
MVEERLSNQARTARRRKITVIVLAVCLLLLFLALGALNAFNLKVLEPATTAAIFIFTAISAIGFLLFVGVLITLVRNVLKLYAEQRSRVLGVRLRTRMLWGAVLLSLVPIAFMFCFSYLLMNRAVERWFSQPAATLRDNATQIGTDLSRYASSNARAEATGLAASLAGADGALISDPVEIQTNLRSREMTLQGGFALVFKDDQLIADFQRPTGNEASIRTWVARKSPNRLPQSTEVASGPVDAMLLQAARRSDDPILSIGKTDYSIGSAWLQGHALVVVALPLPYGMSATLEQMQQSAEQYWTLFRLRRQIRGTYMVLMLMITSLALFAACWLALHLSKQVTKPIETLADAMDEIAHGHYEHRVAETATEELGELVKSFNTMAADLEQSRMQLEASNLQVFEANAVSERRRRELETMLQTIPNGVVMLDAQRRISIVNRAFGEMLDPGGPMTFTGTIDEVLPPDAREAIDRLLRRCHRMGTASTEMEMHTPAGTLSIAATAALIESGLGNERFTSGYVLVLENATELLRAQKQSAWKEVARRVAHEIKNPLTPIALSAEQIRRHIGRVAEAMHASNADSPSIEIIHRSSEVISSSVESMRSLVDQFSALAQFPNAVPRPADLNTIVENALALFAGRLQDIRVVQKLAPGLPLVMADPEALKRALSNLIDNAAEAMQHSLVREIHVSTRISDQAGMAEIVVADTGPGVTNDMRERLFLPYFSTKQRGSGLGLTIAAKIMQDHQGSIRVEKNVPTGARFLLDVPIAAPSAGSDTHAVAGERSDA